MVDKKVETRRNLEQFEKNNIQEVDKFITSGIETQADAMARWSVSPTPLLHFGNTMPEIAEALIQVEIVDPNIEERIEKVLEDLEKATDDDKAFLASVAVAKAKVVEKEGNITLKEKSKLGQFQEKVLDGIGKTIARVGGAKAMRITIAWSLTLTACGTAVVPETPEATQETQPTVTETFVIPTETEAPTPSPTETATSTPTSEAPEISCKFEDGNIVYWQDGGWQEAALPEGTREIGMVEQHEGSWYGIDTYDRAVVRLNEQGEWEEYVRPLIFMMPEDETCAAYYSEDVREIVQREISPEKEIRLLDSQGNRFDYGLLTETPQVEGATAPVDHPDVPAFYVSGIIREITEFRSAEYPTFALEIPLRYERQILITILGGPGEFAIPSYAVPDSGIVDNAAEINFVMPESVWRVFGKQESVGYQIIVGFQGTLGPEDSHFGYEENIEELTTALAKNRAVDIQMKYGLLIWRFWIPSSLLLSE